MTSLAKVFLLLVFHCGSHGDITTATIPMENRNACEVEKKVLSLNYKDGGWSGTSIEVAECVETGA